VNYLVTKGNFIDRADVSGIELAAMYLAAAVHDYEHPGTNNVFHVNTSSTYAVRYNDKSVLENHHVAATFALMKDDNYNIFKQFAPDKYKQVRERMIGMVLATDMVFHFSDVAMLKGRLAGDFDIKKDRLMIMNLIVHSADISNPAKPFHVYRQWTNKILDEFWVQGDKERDLGLPISNLCDRYTVNTAKAQVGFIDFVVAPLLNLMSEVLPGIDVTNLDINKDLWKEEVEYYDKELAELNEKKKSESINKSEIAP